MANVVLGEYATSLSVRSILQIMSVDFPTIQHPRGATAVEFAETTRAYRGSYSVSPAGHLIRTRDLRLGIWEALLCVLLRTRTKQSFNRA